MDMEALRAYSIGSSFALVGMIGALMKTHPNKKELAAVLETQRQFLLMTLTNSNVPDRAIDTFHEVWARAVIDIQPMQKNEPGSM